MDTATALLRRQWTESCATLLRRLDGLTDEEFFWQPCAGCWTVRPDPDAAGGWTMDYPDEVPDPPPVTTIAWRLLHIAHGNWIYWEHAFRPGRRTYLDLETCHDAAAAVADLAASQRGITEALAATDDAALAEPVGTPFGDTWPAADVFRTLLNEQVHHGAEIGLLRDLHLRLAGAAGRPRFHLAVPVDDLDAAAAFYGDVLGCRRGRSAATWIDWDLRDHQFVTHLAERDRAAPTSEPVSNPVDGHDVPVPHFGLLLAVEEFHRLAERLRAAGTAFVIEPYLRFAGLPGEQWTMFVLDPAGNALEFKAFADDSQVFATDSSGR